MWFPRLKPIWILTDPIHESSLPIDRFPFWIGSGTSCELTLSDPTLAQQHLCFTPSPQNKLQLQTQSLQRQILLDGTPTRHAVLQPQTDYSIQIGHHYFFLKGTQTTSQYLPPFPFHSWKLQTSTDPALHGPTDLKSLLQWAWENNLPNDAFLFPDRIPSGFWLHQFHSLLQSWGGPWAFRHPTHSPLTSPRAAANPSNLHSKSHVCPNCWEPFHPSHQLAVSQHEQLLGDPILGPTHSLRFQPLRFNSLKQALDPLQTPTSEWACPHCRLTLPPLFVEQPAVFLGILGLNNTLKNQILNELLSLLPNQTPCPSNTTHFVFRRNQWSNLPVPIIHSPHSQPHLVLFNPATDQLQPDSSNRYPASNGYLQIVQGIFLILPPDTASTSHFDDYFQNLTTLLQRLRGTAANQIPIALLSSQSTPKSLDPIREFFLQSRTFPMPDTSTPHSHSSLEPLRWLQSLTPQSSQSTSA